MDHTSPAHPSSSALHPWSHSALMDGDRALLAMELRAPGLRGWDKGACIPGVICAQTLERREARREKGMERAAN